MNGEHDAILSFAISASLIIVAVSVALATVRLFRGPSLPDRVVALDLIGTIAVGGIAIYAIAEGQPVFLNVSMVLALLMFIGTVAFAYYMHKGSSSADRKGRVDAQGRGDGVGRNGPGGKP